jgi:hypothetical protein
MLLVGPYYVYIFIVENGKPELIWHFETGDRADGGLRQVFAEKGSSKSNSTVRTG